MDIKTYIKVANDWPRPGVKFLDIGGILANPNAFQFCSKEMADHILSCQSTSVIAVESRGFLFASAACVIAKIPLYLARKSRKLPGNCHRIDYATEYSTDSIELQSNIQPGARPVIIDDVVATGGTVAAVASLLGKHWPVEKISAAAVIALDFLPGTRLLDGLGISAHALVHYA